MVWCDCHGCKTEFGRLHDQLRTMEHELARVKRDLEQERDDRRAAVRALADDISMVGQ